MAHEEAIEVPVFRTAVVYDGAVENIIVAPDDFEIEGRVLVHSETAQIGDLYEDSEFTTPEPVPVEPPLPIPALVASGVYTVVEGQVDTLSAVAGITAAFAVDTGIYWLFFTAPQPDLSYAVYPASSAGQINVTTRTTDYFELCVKDGGALTNPTEFSVNIVRST